MNENQLEKICAIYDKDIEPFFRGVFPADTFISHWRTYFRENKLNLYILNTEDSFSPGSHWIVYAREGKEVGYFDSFGRSPRFYGLDLPDVKPSSIITDYRIQGNSKLCGLYCVLACSKLSRGVNLTSFLKNSFSRIDISKNDKRLLNWMKNQPYAKVLKKKCSDPTSFCIPYSELIERRRRRSYGESGDD